jgi:hypothetical protein
LRYDGKTKLNLISFPFSRSINIPIVLKDNKNNIANCNADLLIPKLYNLLNFSNLLSDPALEFSQKPFPFVFSINLNKSDNVIHIKYVGVNYIEIIEYNE